MQREVFLAASASCYSLLPNNAASRLHGLTMRHTAKAIVSVSLPEKHSQDLEKFITSQTIPLKVQFGVWMV